MDGNAYKNQYNPEDIINLLYQKNIIGDGNTGFLQTIIDQSLVFNENIPFWQECFSLDGNEAPANLSDTTINPAWTVRSFQRRMVPMAPAMAPLSETMQLDNEGYSERTGSMHQYGSGLYQNSMGKQALEAKLKSLNLQDQTILGGYVKGLSDMVKAHNSRLSHMAAQTISRGGAYSNSGEAFAGVDASQAAYIPLSNYKKAGAKVWTDTTCDIPEQMRKIADDFKLASGLEENYPMQWDIPYNMAMTVLMTNPAFVKEVNRFIRMLAPDKVIIVNNSSSVVDVNTITMQQLVEYSRSEISKIAPIHIVKEKQQYADFKSYTTVQGWADGVAVLRPLGLAGVVVHAQPKDIAMYQSGEVNDRVSISIAKAQGFLYVVNQIVDDGKYKAYLNDVLGCYATVLNEINYHVPVNTRVAD